MDTQFVQRTHTIISINSIKGKADFTLKNQDINHNIKNEWYKAKY